MEKYKYLGKNIGLLTLSSFGTKFLSFFLVPLYTNILSTTEYGIYDLFNTSIALLIPILTINIHDAVQRFSLGNTEENRIQIFSCGVRLICLSTVAISILTFLNKKIVLVAVIAKYPWYFVLLYTSTALYQLISNFTRGLDKVKEVSIAGIISAASGILLNIILLVYVKMGLDGYFIAAIASSLIPSLYLLFRIRACQYIKPVKTNSTIKREMYAYSVPLVFNAIGWWINSASDRYVVIGICGIAANGIYSVGYKIPSILNTFQAVFNQAWILSSVREFDSEDKDGFFSHIYNAYNGMLVIVCAIIIIATRLIARFMYAKEFYAAWQYVPFLTIAIIFGAISGLIGGVFSAVKDSKIFAISTVAGAIINLVLNFILVYLMGPIGAAIATTVSYIVVWLIRLISVKKHMRLKIHLVRDVTSYVLLLVLTGFLFVFDSSLFRYALSSVVFLFVLFLYRQEVYILLCKLRKLMNR